MPGQITTRVPQTAGSSTFGPALRSAATCFAAGVLLCLWQCVTMVPMTTAAEPPAVEAATLAVFATTCIDCHTAADASGGVNVEAMLEANALSSDAALLERLLDVIESRGMPPDDVDPLDATTRDAVLAELHSRLETATADATPPPVPVSRLNRFQYNNTVRDLFQLDRNIFPLPEKLLTRHDTALAQTLSAGADAQLPDVVQVSCDAVAAAPGLEGVRPFPKDLRASHGYDNQSDKLTLSPLLLDSFLHLSVSILESPDFTADSVGIWQAFFAAPPENTSPEDAIRSRLATFLPLAFRRPVSDDVLSRYTAYTLAKLESEQDFTAAMKKVAAAVLSSPLFLYRTPPATPADEPFALAERLAYSLWGSCPDRELIDLAADGSLTEPAILAQQVERMLADPRIERFLDAFPAQWMQLENILAATPDPSLSRIYSLDPKRPAGTQMVLEPLLLFEAVLLENRPLAELITPTFSYRSAFLDAWYTTPLTPPPVDADAVDGDLEKARAAAQEQFDNHIRGLLQEQTFRRVSLEDPRYGGILTNAAMLTMTSGPKRTHPVARGVWVIEVLFNDPPPPPPNDVPPLDEDAGDASLTIRERFAAHRENPSCAGCHSRLDPLGFALENYDITGRWRDTYTNGRDVDAAGVLRQTHPFDEAIGFKAALLEEQRPIARGLTEHLLRYALGQELTPADRIAVEAIVAATSEHGYRLKDLLRAVLLSPRFRDFHY